MKKIINIYPRKRLVCVLSKINHAGNQYSRESKVPTSSDDPIFPNLFILRERERERGYTLTLAIDSW